MKNIVINPAISSGSPTISGRRLTVYNVVTKVYFEESLKIAIEDYEITLDAVIDAVNYCSTLKCQEEPTIVKFCSGCILRTLQDEWNFKKEEYREVRDAELNSVFTISKDGNEIFIGTIEELENSEFGKVGWLLALEVQNKHSELSNESK
jgi:uncharacterized protein (DUF433 family)